MFSNETFEQENFSKLNQYITDQIVMSDFLKSQLIKLNKRYLQTFFKSKITY